MPALQTLDAFEHRAWAHEAGKRKCLVQTGEIDLAWNLRMLEDGLDFRSEDEQSINNRVVKRVDAEMIACQKEPPLLPVVNDKGKLAI